MVVHTLLYDVLTVLACWPGPHAFSLLSANAKTVCSADFAQCNHDHCKHHLHRLRSSKTRPDLEWLSVGLPKGWKALWEKETGSIFYENKTTKASVGAASYARAHASAAYLEHAGFSAGHGVCNLMRRGWTPAWMHPLCFTSKRKQREQG